MTLISDSLQVMQANILRASNHANRTGLVKLLAVSKSQSADQLRAAYLAGQTAFGENYVQEAIMKQSELADCILIGYNLLTALKSPSAYQKRVVKQHCRHLTFAFKSIVVMNLPKAAHKQRNCMHLQKKSLRFRTLN